MAKTPRRETKRSFNGSKTENGHDTVQRKAKQ
jgi:hypothetical protein